MDPPELRTGSSARAEAPGPQLSVSVLADVLADVSSDPQGVASAASSDVDVMLMGGYEEADVPNGMNSLVGN